MPRKQLRSALIAYVVQLDGSLPMDKPRMAIEGAGNKPKPEHVQAVFDSLYPLLEVASGQPKPLSKKVAKYREDAYNKAMRAMDRKVAKAVKANRDKKVYVAYAAYESDENDVPIDNLDAIAAHGNVRLTCERNRNTSLADLKLSVRATNCLESKGITTVRDLVICNDDELLGVRNFGKLQLAEVKAKLSVMDYRSPVFHDPTWLQVAVCANKMIAQVQDLHHIFLEGISKLDKQLQTEKGVTLYEFDMGS